MKIYAPVKHATGTWASVRFVNGVGETDNPKLIEWFRSHGYSLEKCEDSVRIPHEKCDEPTEKSLEKCDFNSLIEPQNDQIESENDEVDFEAMTPNELRDWMREHGYGSKIKNTRNKEKLLEILRG